MKAYRSLGKSLVSLGVLAGLWAVPALAHAETDSYVELQIGARAMGDLVRRQLGTMSNFCPQAIKVDGVSTYTDHFDFSHEGEFSRASSASRVDINDFTHVEGYAVLYRQPVELHLKTAECAKDPDCSLTTAVSAELTYELYTSPSSQLCMRSYDSRGLPEGVTAPAVDVCLPFSADQAMRAAGLSGQSASGNAVSLDPAGLRVALRIELGRTVADYDAARVDEWQRFVDGEVEKTGEGGDWSVFAHKSLILGAVERRLSDALQAQAGFSVDGPIATSWSPGTDGARIDVGFDGVFAQTLCPGGIHVQNITVTGKVGVNDPAAPTGLGIAGSVEYDVSASDAAACGLSLGGPIGALVLSSLADSIKLDLSKIGPNCRADGDLGFACDEATPLRTSVGPKQLAISTIGSVVGANTGLAMNGRLETSGDAFFTAEGRPTAFDYDEQAQAYEGALQLWGTAKVCDASFWADREGDVGLLQIRAPAGNGLPASYRVALPQENVAVYERSPFELMATVMTSAGVRTYRVGRIVP